MLDSLTFDVLSKKENSGLLIRKIASNIKHREKIIPYDMQFQVEVFEKQLILSISYIVKFKYYF